MPVDFVVSLEGENFANCGSKFNMENTFLSSDGRVVRLPYSFEDTLIPDDYVTKVTKNTDRPGLVEFMANELLEIFRNFADNITDLDFLIDTVRFMFFIVTFCIVSIHITFILFSKIP